MDRFAKEYLKALRKEQNQNKMIAILVLTLLILFMPVLFLLLGGPKKISEMNDSKSHGISGESIASEFNRGVSDIVGTEGTVAVEEQDTRVEDVVRISELQTMEYNYDAICRVQDGGETVYYIAYESTVSLGIDTSQIRFDYGDERNQVITITLPPVQILDTYVDAGSMDYIFVDEAYNNPNASVTAQQFCELDVADKVEMDETMFTSARENTEAEIRALTEPMVEQFYPDYELVIVWG